ncbi:MAG: phosphatase PAP2 family protein [Clostridia bacterium]|nr:phosphatase PAP2 family protein [Clostridia bacterium]
MEGTTFYFSWEPVLMAALQRYMGPAGTTVASVLTMCGEEMLLIAILGFLYWCWDKQFGIFVGTSIVCGIVWNPLVKNLVLRRRPYFDLAGVKCLRAVDSSADIYDISAQGYSFPSGHSTNSTIIYGALPRYRRAERLRQNPRALRFFTILAFVLPFLVGISRVLLGVHYPTDVLVGWAMGAGIMFLVSYLQQKVKRHGLLHLILVLVSLLGIFYCKTTDYYTSLGIMIGFFLALPFEERFVKFENTRSVPRMILRVLGGIALYLVLNTLLKAPFPPMLLEEPTALAFLIRTARYAIIVFFVMAVYPLSFRFLGKKRHPGGLDAAANR